MKENIELDELDPEKEKKVTVKALLYNNNVSVSSSEDIEGLLARGYGNPKGSGLILAFYEALYLLSRDILEIIEGKTKVSFQELLSKNRLTDEDAWVRYLIYRDLRSRGYVVREGFGLGIDFRVYKRGQYGKSSADYLVFGINEGKHVIFKDLTEILRRVQSLKKTLVLSVINRRGEIVYYSLSNLFFK